MKCRWCRGDLEAAPLVELRGLPRAAQSLPLPHELAHERPVNLCIHRCEDCGLVQTLGEPVPYFREVIRANAVSTAMREFRHDQLSAWVARHHLEGQPVLEVGSGRGEFLELLKAAGCHPVGTEHGAQAADVARGQGHTVWPVYPGDGALPDHPGFAAWACFNFLEHWPDPRKVLRHVRQRLAPNAVGLVEVPNFDMILKQRLLTEFIPDHVFYFTADTLRRCLEIGGFEVDSVTPIWQNYILSAEVRLRPVPPLEGFTAQMDQLTGDLRRFAAKHERGGIAVWGAGHQALSTLALSGLAPWVRYVVDSADFKQGRMTPATHLPIRAPSHLRQEPVAAVIVMAAGYSDEVVSILRNQFHPALCLAVVREQGLEVLPSSQPSPHMECEHGI